MNRTRNAVPTEQVKLEAIIRSLFPTHYEREPMLDLQTTSQDPVSIKPVEVLATAHTLRKHKTPGPDGTPNRAVKLAVTHHSDTFV